MHRITAFLVLSCLALRGAWCHGPGPYDHPKNAWRADETLIQINPQIHLGLASPEEDGVFRKDRQRVKIQWQGVPNPQASDLIGFWVGKGDVNPRHAVPVHYANCSLLNPEYLKTGSGSSSFMLVNMRWDFHFKLIRGGYKKPTIVAEAPSIKNEIPNAPTSGHLALHADQKSVVVQWVSAAPYPQVVEFGPRFPSSPEEARMAAASAATGHGEHMHPDVLSHGVDAIRSCEAAAASASTGGAAANEGFGVPTEGALDARMGVTAGGSDLQEMYTNAGGSGIRPDSAQPVACINPLGGSSYQFRATSFRDSYRPSDMCGFPATSVGFIDPGYIHTVVMSHKLLQPGKRYYYRYGSEEDGWSEGQSFIAPVPPQLVASSSAAREAPAAVLTDTGVLGPVATGIEFLAFDDVAMTNPLLFNDFWADGLHFAEDYGQNSSLLATHLASGAEKDANLALMTGDLAYALGYAADWDVFGSQFEKAFTQWPMAVGTGNHERDYPSTGDAFGTSSWDSGGECNVPFMWRWYSPANIHRNPFKSFYSFNMGPVHILMLDSEIPSDPSSDQGRFVAHDLASVDRELTPWVVASLHRMMVAPATWRRKTVGDVDNMERLQQDYEELFLQHQVDLVIQGHEHAYARTCPYKHGECQEERRMGARKGGDPTTTTTSSGSSGSSNSGDTSSGSSGGWEASARQLLGRRAAAASFGLASGTHTMREGSMEGGVDAAQQQEKGVCEDSYAAPAGGPVYMLTGHGGAGFTHGFPHPLPPWVAYGKENVNGYLRVSATRDTLKVEAIGLKRQPNSEGVHAHSDGTVQDSDAVASWLMDCVSLVKADAQV